MSSSKSTQKGRIVGIDFGTSTTSVAYSVPRGDGGVDTTVVDLEKGEKLMRSYVRYHDGKFSFGSSLGFKSIAKGSLKAQLTRWDSTPDVPFEFESGDGKVDGKKALTEFLREVVRRSRENSKMDDLAGKNDTVYICCPASWSRNARSLLFDCARDAGINMYSHRQLIDEPVAAGWHILKDLIETEDKPRRVMIFDAGGGTVDVALLEWNPKASSPDRRLITVINADARPESGDALDRAFALMKLGKDDVEAVEKAEQAKVALSSKDSIALPFATNREDLGLAYRPILERQVRLIGESFQRALLTEEELAASATGGKVETMSRSIARRFRFTDIETSTDSMKDAPHAFDVVYLTGGMAQIAELGKVISEIFQWAKVQVIDDPQLAVCKGLTRMQEALWINGSRLPVSIRARWNVKGLSRSEVRDRYPDLEQWMSEQENIDLIPAHCNPWTEDGVGVRASSDFIPGSLYVFPGPDKQRFPSECNWKFEITLQVVDNDGKPVDVSQDRGGTVTVAHHASRPATYRLLASRQIVVAGSDGERFLGHVTWDVWGIDLAVQMFRSASSRESMKWPYLEDVTSNVTDVPQIAS